MLLQDGVGLQGSQAWAGIMPRVKNTTGHGQVRVRQRLFACATRCSPCSCFGSEEAWRQCNGTWPSAYLGSFLKHRGKVLLACLLQLLLFGFLLCKRDTCLVMCACGTTASMPGPQGPSPGFLLLASRSSAAIVGGAHIDKETLSATCKLLGHLC